MSAGGNSRAMIAVILVGFLSFLGVLALMGSGAAANVNARGGNHAASAGLEGFRAFRLLAQRRGFEVEVARSREALESQSVTILTPPLNADPAEVEDILASRRRDGPTILILPKWLAFPVEDKPGWSRPQRQIKPGWVNEIETLDGLELLDPSPGDTGWQGMGLTGDFARERTVAAMRSSNFLPLVRDGDGRMLAGVLGDGSATFALGEAAGLPASAFDSDPEFWPLVVVSEPDLLDNWGFADREEAQLAMRLLDASVEDTQFRSVVFDVTLNGLSAETNLLTLAFRPPFLAATLCLILAAIALMWRSFARFGPALAEHRSIDFGKTQLVANSAALVERTRRYHLLGEPYARLYRRRIERRLGIPYRRDPGEAEYAIDRRLARRGMAEDAFSGPAGRLRSARKPAELLRAASELKDLERTLS